MCSKERGSTNNTSELGDEMNAHIYTYKSITFLLKSQKLFLQEVDMQSKVSQSNFLLGPSKENSLRASY